MSALEITFENLPMAVAHLASEIAKIKSIVEQKQASAIPTKKIPIDISEAAKLVGKAKPTIYTLVRERKIPCYKKGKKLYFFEDELLDWIANGKRKTSGEIEAEALRNFNKTKKA